MTQDLGSSGWLGRRDLLGFGILGAALGILAWRALERPAPDAPPALSVEETHMRAHAGSLILIDIRRPDEWQATGIPEGAHPIDMRRDDFITALQDVTGPDRAAPIALICARGVRTARMASALIDAGFTQIIDVPEGMIGSSAGPGWLAKGLPVTAYVILPS